jgi:hypothetical protein
MLITARRVLRVLGGLSNGMPVRGNRIGKRVVRPLRGRKMTLASVQILPWLLLLMSAGGCATQQQILAQKQGGATQTALERAKFEMNCPSANATVLSKDFIQPAIQGAWVGGLERVEYTIGVEGCKQRKVYIILCQVGSSTCFAANSDDPRYK